MRRGRGIQGRKRFVAKRTANERAEARRINARQRRLIASGAIEAQRQQAAAEHAEKRAERASSMSDDYMYRQYDVSTNGSADEDT